MISSSLSIPRLKKRAKDGSNSLYTASTEEEEEAKLHDTFFKTSLSPLLSANHVELVAFRNASPMATHEHWHPSDCSSPSPVVEMGGDVDFSLIDAEDRKAFLNEELFTYDPDGQNTYKAS